MAPGGLRSVEVIAACALSTVACGAPAVPNGVPQSRTELIPGAQASDQSSYVYVARRPRASVGLAETRNIPLDAAREAVDRLADGLDSCIATEQRRGARATTGAVRVAVHVDDHGGVRETAVRTSSAPGAARVAVVCLVVPLRLMTFPPGSPGDRGLAVEALWNTQPAAP